MGKFVDSFRAAPALLIFPLRAQPGGGPRPGRAQASGRRDLSKEPNAEGDSRFKDLRAPPNLDSFVSTICTQMTLAR